MVAQIIPFPGLIERVAHRMLVVMEAPPGDERDEAFVDATIDLDENQLTLSPEQWAAVWRRVHAMMSTGPAAARSR